MDFRQSRVDVSDILFINEKIKNNLEQNIGNVKDEYEELKRLLWIEENGMDTLERTIAKEKIKEVRSKINDLEFGYELSLYLFRSSKLIEDYKKINKILKADSFVKTDNKDDSLSIRRNNILLEYLRIAREYIDLDHYYQKPQKIACDGCHKSNLSPTNEDDSILVCKDCGNITELLDDAPSFKDAERVNMASRYTYTCRGHFIEAMNRFEGKQSSNIDEYVIKIIKKQLYLHNLTDSSATKDHIYMFLSENKLSDYYADINLIYFMITGTNPPDITSYRQELLEMHDQIEEAYHEVKDDDRLNSLNVNWKLYKLLQILDYPCKKSDFFCLKTPAKQGEHEEKWRDMIDYLSMRYESVYTSFGKKRWRHIRTL